MLTLLPLLTLVRPSDVPQFSFVYDGHPSREFLPSWTCEVSAEEAAGERRERIRYADPGGGLRLTVHVRRFADFPAVEWFLEFENGGAADTPILERILPLEASAPVPATDRICLHFANGSLCRVDDFLPQAEEFGPGAKKTLAPRGGRSSNGVLPFMNVQGAAGGVVLGIGWSGQWAASFERDKQALRLSAGMEKTHLRLRPGEKVRTPRVLLLFWEGGDAMAGNNLLRRLLLAHYLPRVDGRLVMPPVAQCLQAYYYLTGQAGERFEMTALPKAAALGCDVYWIDACWYGRSGREWWEEVGSWTVNRERFPHGLRPISDAAHKAGMKFVLWFEPERVRRGSILEQEHPEFLRRREGDADTFLLDLGRPEARRHITDLVSRLITECGVDIYRQDFNFDPLPYWQQADEPDRVGMSEIRHVEGLYEFWDDLRRRHPGLWIDNCASGGRRIDLETLSRSLPLWPSDFSDVVGLRFGMDLHVGDQCVNAGLARWVPLFGGGVWNFTPYGTRSQILGGFTFGFHIDHKDYAPESRRGVADFKEVLSRGRTLLGDDFPMEEARAAVAEWRSLQPFFVGDFHPLLALTAAAHDWCAYQLHREDLGAGFAVFLRRHQSPFAAMQVELRDIDPAAEYEVSMSEGYAEAPRRRMAGRDLARLSVSISERPGSMLLRYARLAAAPAKKK